MSRSLLVVAGEVSGDMHAGPVIRALRSRLPNLEVFGIGGDELAAAGAELLVHAREMAIFGPFAAVSRYPYFRRVFHRVLAAVKSRRPDAALLVDYGGFNLRLAKELKASGVKMVYFISPQVWASRPGRKRKMANLVDRLLVIFPFETESYADTGLRVDYVGHPLIDRLEEVQRQGPEELPWPGTVPIALLPGSRTQEIAAILPLMLDAAQKIESMTPEAGFLVAAGDAAAAEQIDSVSARHATSPSCIEVVTGKTGEVLRQARAAWVASGTANLEAALFDCPHSVVYRTSPWLYALAWLIVEVDHIGIVNLVAGEEICRELIQSKATAHTLTQAMVPLLDDTPQRRAMLDAFHDIRERLGPVGAIGRVADILVEELNADG